MNSAIAWVPFGRLPSPPYKDVQRYTFGSLSPIVHNWNGALFGCRYICQTTRFCSTNNLLKEKKIRICGSPQAVTECIVRG